MKVVYTIGYYGMKTFNFIFVNGAKLIAWVGARCIDGENYFAAKLDALPKPNTLNPTK